MQFNIIITKENFNKLFNKLWHAYLLFLLLFVIIKFNGNIYNLIDRIKQIHYNRSLGYWNVNLVPFRSIAPYIKEIHSNYAFMNIIGNIVSYIPLGFLMPLAFRKYRSFWKVSLRSFVIIIIVESLQFLLLLGYFDVDDIMLNMLSAILGFLFFKFLLLCYHIKLSWTRMRVTPPK